MTNSDFVASVRAELRLILNPSNKQVQRGSPLWNRLRKETSGRCAECGCTTEQYDAENGDWCCSGCSREIVRGQEIDRVLDDPRHNQAAELNAKFWDIP